VAIFLVVPTSPMFCIATALPRPETGCWFDLVWNLNMAVPLVICGRMGAARIAATFPAGGKEREKKIYTRFSICFSAPDFVLRIAHVRLVWRQR